MSLVAESIREVPRAYGQAEMALQLSGPVPAVTLLEQHLRRAVVHAAGELGTVLAERTLGPLREGLSDAERRDLTDTLQCYLAVGSIAVTAERMLCHRNTVLNRFRRLRELTGLDPARPSDLATFVLALDAGGHVHREAD